MSRHIGIALPEIRQLAKAEVQAATSSPRTQFLTPTNSAMKFDPLALQASSGDQVSPPNTPDLTIKAIRSPRLLDPIDNAKSPVRHSLFKLDGKNPLAPIGRSKILQTEEADSEPVPPIFPTVNHRKLPPLPEIRMSTKGVKKKISSDLLNPLISPRLPKATITSRGRFFEKEEREALDREYQSVGPDNQARKCVSPRLQ